MEPSRSSTVRAAVAVVLSVAAVGFTTTAVTVGTRGMARELSLSVTELGWVINGYLVAGASLALLGGRLGDIVGRLRTFTTGLVIFAAASFVGLVGGGFAVLLASRIGQGVGAALVLPAGIELIIEHSRPGHEGRGFRWRGLIYTTSFAVGPLVGGLLTDSVTWRWIFAIDVVLAVAAIAVALPLRGHPGRGSASPTRDVAGAVLAAILVCTLVVVAERVATWSWVSPPSLGSLAVIVVSAALLVRHERRTEHPLIHPSLLADRRVLGANVATVGAALGMLSLLYFFNLFAQSVAGLRLGAAAVVVSLVPFMAALALCASIAHWLGHRLSPRGPAVLGLGLMVVGFAMLATTGEGTARDDMLVALVLSGVGAGIANASLTSVAVLHLPAGRTNEAAGWVSLSRFLGSAMALAVGTATFLSIKASAALTEAGATTDARGNAFDRAFATLDRDLSGPIQALARADTAERFARTMLSTSIVLAVITVVSWWLMRPAPTPAEPDPTRPSEPLGDHR